VLTHLGAYAVLALTLDHDYDVVSWRDALAGERGAIALKKLKSRSQSKRKPRRLLDRAELRTLKGITFCPTHLLRMIKDGRFPAPVKPFGRKRFWDEEVIDNWIVGLGT
jgi:predicted DNA-binding transcriptional regulator AlpA